MFNQVAPPANTALRRLGRGIRKTAEKLKPNEGAACAVEGSPSFQCSGSFRTGFKLLNSAIRALRSLPTCPKKRTTPDDGKVDFNHHFSLRRDSRTTVAQRDRLPLRRFRRRRNKRMANAEQRSHIKIREIFFVICPFPSQPPRECATPRITGPARPRGPSYKDAPSNCIRKCRVDRTDE